MAKLFIAVAIRDNSARQTLLARLEQLNAKGALANRLQCESVMIETYAGAKLHQDLEAAERALIDFYVTGASSWAILISDSFVDERKPAEVVLHLADQFLGKAFGTIGLDQRGARVPEIDRILKPNASPDQVNDALELVAARLRYVTPPIRSQRKVEFQIRRIRDEYELKQCFSLRHRIYSIMGYLEDRKEAVPSRMEIDALDEVAIHFGAFYKNQGFDTLAGTFRVVLVNQAATSFTGWTRRLLDSDPQLRTLVRSESYPLRLPVFQSQQLDDHLQESIQQHLNCAELSRVIVAEDYRGLGLSTQLVERAQLEARNQQVHRFYLECLRQHEPLYAKLGFQTIPGKAGRVIGVNRTMIPMRQQLGMPAVVATTPVAVS